MNPQNKTVLLLGGGHSHALALPAMARRLPPEWSLALASEDSLAPYSGMVPGHIAGHYRRDECFINLPALAQKCGAKFIRGRAVGLDCEKRIALMENGGALPFEILSINTGGIPNPPPEIFSPQRDRRAKPVGRLAEWLDEWRDEANPKVAIVGAGPAGIEIALALKFRFRSQGRDLRLAVAERGNCILPSLPESARARVLRVLGEREIEVRLNAEVSGRDPSGLRFANGERLETERVVFATPVGPPEWVSDSGLALDERGFIAVNGALETSRRGIFACGDAASFGPRPLPKSGVYAVRQGPPLARNLLAAARGLPLTEWIPQHRALAIVSVGEKRAIAARGRRSAEGEWVWRWKNFLDRRFMNRFA